MAFNLADAAIFIGANLDGLKRGFNDAKRQTNGFVSNLGSSIATLAGGAIVTGVTALATGIIAVGGAALNASNDLRNATGDIQAQLGVTQDRAEELRGITANIFGNNFGENIEEANAGLIITAQNMERLGGVSDEVLQSSTEKAFALRDAFGIELSESTNAAVTLMDTFGLSSNEAFDLITSGMQKGLDSSGDFLDSIGEYSGLFAQSGGTADQFFSLLQSGLSGGVLGTDKAADAFKEFRIRFLEGSDDVKKAVEELTGDGWEMFMQEVEAGDSTVASVFDTFTRVLGEVEDPLERNRLAIALMGTQAEDLGADFVASLDLAMTSLDDMAGATDTLNAQYQSLGDFFQGLWRRGLVALTPVTDKLLEMANQARPLIEEGFAKFETVVVPAIISTVDWLGELSTKIGEGKESADAFFRFLSGDSITETIDSAWGQVLEVLGNTLDNLWPLAEEKLDLFFETFALWVESVDWYEVGRVATELLLQAFDIWLDVQALMDQLVFNLFDWMLQQEWERLWSNPIEVFKEVLDGMWAEIKPIFDGMWDGITDWFREKAGEAANLGRDLVDGIRVGVEEAAQGLIDAAASLVTRAISAAKQAARSDSPSKESEEKVGVPIVQGIERPLVRGRERIAKAMANLVAMPAGMGDSTNIGTNIGSQRVGGDTFNIYEAEDSASLMDQIEQAKRKKFQTIMGF